jgi:redox-sensitive bicupin YhaK (pirin superfamily)
MMNKKRKVRMILKSKPVIEGAGVHLQRVFGFSEVPKFDPFLMLDDFRSDNPEHFRKGFPWHPHRGIETITYVLKGDVEHGDSMGNKGIISSGDVQWMTAGSGIIHQEMPKGDAQGSMHGFQLWTNLPSSQKMMDSRYRGITASQIPEVVMDNGVRIKIIAGTVSGTTGPVRDVVTNPEYLDCNVPEGVEYVHATKPDHTAFIYIIDGKGVVNDNVVENQTLILFDTGEEFAIKSTGKHVRFLLLTGEPLKETIAWQGPIVMNTQTELETAFREYQEGNFVKHKQSKIS